MRRILPILLGCTLGLVSTGVFFGQAVCPPDCTDNNPCTVDSCDTAAGVCRHVPLNCDDGNPCTVDSCDATTGCVAAPLPAGTACDDGTTCTEGDYCDRNARCTGSNEPSGMSCDDRNACTSADVCNGEGACLGVHQSPGSPCEDGSACTTGDTCVQDAAGAIACLGIPTICDSGDLCTVDACDPATGQCVARPLNCDDGSECTEDTCTSTGGCQHRSRSGDPCDDHNACNLNDRLICSVNQIFCEGQGRVDCGMGFCTYDSCNPTLGCVHVDLGAQRCDDGNACTTDICVPDNRTCRHDPRNCDDGNPCTVESCNAATGCVAAPLPAGTACDDGSTCTQGDFCDRSGRCTGRNEPSGTSCDDRNACTSADACDGTGACVGVPRSAGSPCDDGSACTMGDTCAKDATGAMACRGTPRTCDSGDTCTVSACDPATGACVARPRDCDDRSDCTEDSCTSLGGCQHRSLAGGFCDDHNACNINDHLTCGGTQLTCMGESRVLCEDNNWCTYDRCNPTLGCEHIDLGSPRCDDGNACTTDTCVSTGGCLHPPKSCDDGTACTADSCDPAVGCTHAVIPGLGSDCLQTAQDITVTRSSPLGKGSGTITWTTTHEISVSGFNVQEQNRDGTYTRLNLALIPCSRCVTGQGATYAFILPKQRSGRDLFIEVLGGNGDRIGIFGPASRQAVALGKGSRRNAHNSSPGPGNGP